MILSTSAILRRACANTAPWWVSAATLLMAAAIGIAWIEAGRFTPDSTTDVALDLSVPMMPMVLLLFPHIQP